MQSVANTAAATSEALGSRLQPQRATPLSLAFALLGGKNKRAAGIRSWAVRAPEHEPADAGALPR